MTLDQIWKVAAMTSLRSALTRAALVAVADVILVACGAPAPSGAPTSGPTLLPWSVSAFPSPRHLADGRYHAVVEGVPLSFLISAPDWVSNARYPGVLTKIGGTLGFWSPDDVYIDPCDHTQGASAGPSAADLAAAIAAMPGVVASPPTDITLDRVTGKHVALAVPEDVDCTAREFHLWYDDVEGPRWPTGVPSNFQIWIVDVGPARIFIEAERVANGSLEVEQEMEDIVHSIQFE